MKTETAAKLTHSKFWRFVWKVQDTLYIALRGFIIFKRNR